MKKGGEWKDVNEERDECRRKDKMDIDLEDSRLGFETCCHHFHVY